jgi:hypothetical protein
MIHIIRERATTEQMQEMLEVYNSWTGLNHDSY